MNKKDKMDKIYEIYYDFTTHNVLAEPTLELSQPDNVMVLISFCEIISDVIKKLGEFGYDVDESMELVISTISACIHNKPDLTN